MRKLVAVLAVVAAFVTAATAQAASHPRLTLSVNTFKVLYGKPVTLSGRATNGMAGQRVTVWARRAVASPAKVATVHTRAGGRWSIALRPAIGTSYTAKLGTISSRTLTVGVQPLLRATVLGNGSIRASATAGRAFTGSEVQLQQLQDRHWTTIAKKPLGAHSRATFSALPSASRLRLAMSVNQAGNSYLGSISHAFVYQPHALTLVPAQFKVLYGKVVTLTGRLANAHAGQRVTVLARPYGRSAPIRVGVAMTNARGDFSIRVHPVRMTAYQAIAAGKQSPKKTVGVMPLITLRELSNGYVTAHVAGGKTFVSRNVKLQQQRAGGGWSTVKQKPLNGSSKAVFGVTLPSGRLRVAMSVNQAGAGYLGSISHVLVYRGT